MICLLDIRKAILDKINTEFVQNRPTFKREGVDTFVVTNQGRATNRRQAKEVAKSLRDRARTLFNNGVDAYITEYSAYDPIRVVFTVSDTLINQYAQEVPPTLFQTEGVEQSKASPKTIQKVKDWLDRSGIQLQELDTERFGGTNGVALTLDKIVQVAEGKEDVAITEEAMHMLTQMIKVGNKTLFNKMMSKITQYQMYTNTKDIYQDNPSYINEDGSPNIPKIKEEAIGKILAEYYLKEQNDANGELLSQSKSWWNQILDWLKELLHINSNPFTMSIQQMDKLSPSTIAPETLEALAKRIQERVKGALAVSINLAINNGDFKSAVTFIGDQLSDFDSYEATLSALEGDTQLAEDVLNTLGRFSQLSPTELGKKLDGKISQFNLTKHESKNDPDDENNSSYYTATIDGKTVETDRTTEWAKSENRKNNGGRDIKRTPEELKKDGKKAMAGTQGHYDIEGIIRESTNQDGTLKNIDDIDLSAKPSTNPAIYAKFVQFLLGTEQTKGFLYNFPEGSRFRVEQKILNEKARRTVTDKKTGQKKELKGRAGTIDLLVEKPDGSLEIYDWKFMGFLLSKPDQSFLKRSQHAYQLADYRRTLKETYGVTSEIKAFTIPIHAQYRDVTNKDTGEKVPTLISVTMGNTVLKDETRTPLIPVVPDDQSTGNKDVDTLIKRLRARYAKLYKKRVSDGEWEAKIDQLNQISESIRNLQVGINFAPLSVQAKNFQESIKKTLSKYEGVDLAAQDAKYRQTTTEELLDIIKSSDYYSNLDQTFISVYGSENLSEDRAITLENLRQASSVAKEETKKIIEILNKLAVIIAENEGFDNYMVTQKEVVGMINTFTEGVNVPNKAISLMNTLNLKKKSQVDINIAKQSNEFSKIYLDLVESARVKGSTPYKMIASGEKHKLISHISSDFYKEKDVAIANEDKKWLKDNIDVEAYKTLADKTIKERIASIEERIYNNDPKVNAARRKKEIEDVKKAFNIDRQDFNGWTNKTFTNYLLPKVLKIEGKESKEYLEMSKDPTALAMYNWIIKFNSYLRKIGYLEKDDKINFLPFIKATTLQRLADSKNKQSTIKNILSDLVTVNVNENQSYGKTDEETNEVNRNIPTFFTVDQGENSRDLLLIMTTMIKAANEFEGAQDLEDTFNLLLKVEQNKGHLETRNGQVIFENDKPKIFDGNTKNSELLEKFIDDYSYGITQESDTAVDTFIKKNSEGTEEQKEEKAFKVKKAIVLGNTLTQQLAVGLKALVAIPNFVGGNMQAGINSGHYYNGGEFIKNEARVVGSTLTNVEKALLNMMVPLNEDVAKETIRKTAWKQGFWKWAGTWSFNDVMMSSNQLPDKALQLANALSWLQNTMLDEKGNLVNIRQYVKKSYSGRYNLPLAQRKEMEAKMEKEIKELKEKQAITKKAKIVGDELVIEGLNESSLADYRTKIVEYARYITGQMSQDNRADYQRNIIMRSFMMFKNWIPKQWSVRGLDIHKSPILEEWEYGRTRLFAKTVLHLGYRNILNIKNIIRGDEKGLQHMRAILDKKREEYYKKTGEELTISEEEFFDMMRRELQNEMKELQMILGLVALVVAAKLAAPDDEEDDLRKNRYKLFARSINKISDELFFYYNPLSMESITRGTVLPSLGLLSKASNILSHTTTEIFGVDLGDREFNSDEVREKNNTLKYWMNLVPVASQFQTEILPIIDPEAAKELGIRLTVEARAMQ